AVAMLASTSAGEAPGQAMLTVTMSIPNSGKNCVFSRVSDQPPSSSRSSISRLAALRWRTKSRTSCVAIIAGAPFSAACGRRHGGRAAAAPATGPGAYTDARPGSGEAGDKNPLAVLQIALQQQHIAVAGDQ